MTQNEAFVGIDVGKHELVIHLHPVSQVWRADNDPKGRTALARRLARLAQRFDLRIGLEASGGYERKLAVLLEKQQLCLYLLDPLRVRSFARAEGKRAKTDPLDAALIARALAALHGELLVWKSNPIARRLAERVRLRELFLKQQRQLENQLESLSDPASIRVIKAMAIKLKARIAGIEAIIAQAVRDCPTLARREALLRSAPGVGPIVAATLLAHIPELGSLSSRQVASLAGLAPFDHQSGTIRKPSHCHGGRPALRRVLYLAALSAMRSKSNLANLAKRLKSAGKPAKITIIATARKLLVTLNAMLKTEQTFQPA